MQNYLLQFSGENHTALRRFLYKERRKLRWDAMTEEEKEQEFERIKRMIDDALSDGEVLTEDV